MKIIFLFSKYSGTKLNLPLPIIGNIPQYPMLHISDILPHPTKLLKLCNTGFGYSFVIYQGCFWAQKWKPIGITYRCFLFASSKPHTATITDLNKHVEYDLYIYSISLSLKHLILSWFFNIIMSPFWILENTNMKSNRLYLQYEHGLLIHVFALILYNIHLSRFLWKGGVYRMHCHLYNVFKKQDLFLLALYFLFPAVRKC